MSDLNRSKSIFLRSLTFITRGEGHLFFRRTVAYIKSWSEIPSGNTPVALTKSVHVVTMRSISVEDSIVFLVGSAITLCILTLSNIHWSLTLFVLLQSL